MACLDVEAGVDHRWDARLRREAEIGPVVEGVALLRHRLDAGASVDVGPAATSFTRFGRVFMTSSM